MTHPKYLLFKKSATTENIFKEPGKRLLELPNSYLVSSTTCNRYSLLLPVLTNDEPTLIPIKTVTSIDAEEPS